MVTTNGSAQAAPGAGGSSVEEPPVHGVPGPAPRWDAWLARLGVRGPRARDALGAAVAAALMAGVAALTTTAASVDVPHARAALPWVVALVTAQCLALAVRRARLDVCLAVVVVTQVTLVALLPDVSVRSVAAVVAGVTVGTHLPTGRALRVAGAAALAEAAGATVAVTVRDAGGTAVLQHAVSALLVWGASAMVGTYVATRRDLLRLERERAARLERERDARVRSAVADERARLARELHDVAAHHLSGMVVQAAAVERLVARDPDAARAGAVWLREQGRATLDNLRQVVGLLRGDDAPDGTTPLPGVAALGDLVADARHLGDDVELAEVGHASPLPPLADVSVYRVAQQALTNARQHAPGVAVRVLLEHAADAVVLDVVNGPPTGAPSPAAGSHGGSGLAVMRERATLVGGDLQVGATGDGGWRVRLRVPVERAGAAPVSSTGDGTADATSPGTTADGARAPAPGSTSGTDDRAGAADEDGTVGA